MRQKRLAPKKITMSKWLLIIFIISSFMIVSCGTADDEINPDSDDDDMMMNDNLSGSAPDFELTALDGSKVRLTDQDDKVVVLFFFGNTCPSCKAVAPNVEEKLNADYAGRTDYVILGLDQWDGNGSSVQAFKDNTNVTFPLLLKASAVAKDYDTTYDRLVVIDQSGKIVHKGSRGASNDLNDVKSKVDELLGS